MGAMGSPLSTTVANLIGIYRQEHGFAKGSAIGVSTVANQHIEVEKKAYTKETMVAHDVTSLLVYRLQRLLRM